MDPIKDRNFPGLETLPTDWTRINAEVKSARGEPLFEQGDWAAPPCGRCGINPAVRHLVTRGGVLVCAGCFFERGDL